MALDRHGNYRRSRWVDGQVVTDYFPAGPCAETAARLAALERDCRDLRRAAERHEREQADARDAPLRELDQLLDQLVRAALLAEGYHQHDRGQWRKRRVQQQSLAPVAAELAPGPDGPGAPGRDGR